MTRKQFIRFTFLVLFLWISYNQTPAQKIDPAKRTSEDSIYLLIDKKTFEPTDTITLTWWPEYYSTTKRKSVPHHTITAPLKGDHFTLKINGAQRPGYFTLSVKSQRRPLLEHFLAAPGDSVLISFYGTTPRFMGKSAAKYACQQTMKQQQTDIRTHFGKSLGALTASSFITFYEKKYQEFDSIARAQMHTLHTSSKDIDDPGRRWLLADIVGQNKYMKAYAYCQSIRQINTMINDPARADSAKKAFNIMYASQINNIDEKIGDEKKAGSKNYIQFLLWHSRTQAQSEDDVLQHMISNYTGILKDKLVTTYLLEKYEYITQAEEAVRKILETISHQQSHTILERMLARGAGSPAFNFSLPDINGEQISLKDFTGDVLLMNFWFTGCSGSESYNKHVLTPILEEYRRSDVKVVTISVDRDKEKWQKSIESNTYTAPAMVNLWTEGEGSDHPVARHYSISEYPTPILIGRDGRILSINVEDLRKKENLMSLIDQALKYE